MSYRKHLMTSDEPPSELYKAAEVGTGCSEFPNNSDTISRQKAINALYEWECDNKDDRDAIDVINGLPTILPERKECEEREQGKCPWYAG